MTKLFLSSIPALFLATGAAYGDERSLDEIILDFALSSSLRPHPEDIAGAIHYPAGTYPYPHVLTDDDIWAFQTNLQMLKTLPPVEYDHPYAADLYILDGKSRCTTDIKDDWPKFWEILDRFVRPERQVTKNKKNKAMYDEWWKYWRP